MKDLLEYGSYAFVLAHPDDEMYTANVIKSLAANNKRVDLVYLTSGDYAGGDVGARREKELANAVELLGIPQENLHLLRFPERQLAAVFGNALQTANAKLAELQPECVITHEYEGGHNIHDLTSYCAYAATKKNATPEKATDLWTFPAYHKQPHERLWNQFSAGKKADFTLELDENAAALKHQIFDCHSSQKEFFDRVLTSSSKDFLLSREILRYIDTEIDYTTKPTTPVGYEFTGSPVEFDSFADVIKAHTDC